MSFDWAEQPVLSGSRRAEFYWEGSAGTGAALATAIRGWEHLRFEVSEDPTPRSDGGRWLHTPGLGIHYAQTDSAGNVVIGEDRIRYAMEVAAGDPLELQRELQVALGAAWDDELEPFRHASDDAAVVWLHKVGLTSARPARATDCTRLRRFEAPLPVVGDGSRTAGTRIAA